MNTSKLVVFAASALMSACVLADAANVLVSFSTPGPDTYQDGATVIDGERYALVWSADGNFDGIKTDCTPVDPNDLVIYVASLAKGGCCPFTVFQIDSKSPDAKRDGVYGVYLLDTRTADKAAVVATVNGLPETVVGAKSAQDFTAAAAMASVKEKKDAAAKTWGETAVAVDTTAADFKPAEITAIKVNGAKVELTVAGMLPGVRYNVKMGAKPNQLKTYALDVPKTASDNNASFVIDQKDARFFQVVREPLSK